MHETYAAAGTVGRFFGPASCLCRGQPTGMAAEMLYVMRYGRPRKLAIPSHIRSNQRPIDDGGPCLCSKRTLPGLLSPSSSSTTSETSNHRLDSRLKARRAFMAGRYASSTECARGFQDRLAVVNRPSLLKIVHRWVSYPGKHLSLSDLPR